MEINRKQWEYLQKVSKKGNVSRAYLFVGPEGIGKLSTAFDFACLVNGIQNKDIVRQGRHPDVVIVEPEIEGIWHPVPQPVGTGCTFQDSMAKICYNLPHG